VTESDCLKLAARRQQLDGFLEEGRLLGMLIDDLIGRLNEYREQRAKMDGFVAAIIREAEIQQYEPDLWRTLIAPKEPEIAAALGRHSQRLKEREPT